jgi:prepilin-type N-terminal cleavage/methylation domain-containing protein
MVFRTFLLKLSSRLRNSGGFSVVEVIIVIAILGIISSVSVMSYNGSQDVLLKKCSYRLAQDIRNIQMKTVYEKDTRYKMYLYSDGMPDGYRIMLGSNLIEEVKFDDGITYTTTYVPGITSAYLKFSLSGAPNYGGTLTLTNRKGTKKIITVLLSTGRVRIMD